MVDNNRMNFFLKNQEQLKAECYQGIYDYVKVNASNDSTNFESKERLGIIIYLYTYKL